MDALSFGLFGAGVFVGVVIMALVSVWDARSGSHIGSSPWLRDDNEPC